MGFYRYYMVSFRIANKKMMQNVVSLKKNLLLCKRKNQYNDL